MTSTSATTVLIFVFSMPLFLVLQGALTSAMANKECQCVSQLVYDVMRESEVMNITFIVTDNEEPLNPDCLASSGLMQKLWALGLQLEFLLHSRPEERTTLRSRTNVVGFYNNDTRYLISKASERGDLLESVWLLIATPSSRDDLMAQAKGFDAFIDSTFLVALYTECQAQIESPYRVGPRGGLIVEDLGSWSPSVGFEEYRRGVPKYDRRRDFQGYPMQGIGVKVFKHFVNYLDDGQISGYVGEIVTILSIAHNFSLTYRTLEGYAYGTLVDPEKNQWNGLVGELQNKRADLTICELAYLKERVEVVDYTQPIVVISYKMYVSTPEDLEKKVLAYVLPMESILYVCVCATMVIIVFTLVLLERIRSYLLPEKMEGEPIGPIMAIWYMTSVLFQQGCDTIPSAVPSRIIFLFSLILGLLMYTHYSAKLISQLAVERPTPLPFSNLHDLSYQTDWNAGNNQADFFQVTASQVCANPKTEFCRILNRLWVNIISRKPENLASNYTDGLNKALQGRYVFLGVDVSTQYFLSLMPPKDACRIKIMPRRYLPVPLGIGLQYNSPFRGIFDHSIQKLREDGVLNKLTGMFLRADRRCTQETVVVTEAMDVATPFMILLSGMGISLLVFLCERGAKRMKSEPPTFVRKF